MICRQIAGDITELYKAACTRHEPRRATQNQEKGEAPHDQTAEQNKGRGHACMHVEWGGVGRVYRGISRAMDEVAKRIMLRSPSGDPPMADPK